MNLKSVHTKPAPKAESKKVIIDTVDAATLSEARGLALKYIDEWVNSPAVQAKYFPEHLDPSVSQDRSNVKLEQAADWLFWLMMKPRQDSEKNRKNGTVGTTRFEEKIDQFINNNTNKDTTWQQKLRGYVSAFCNGAMKGEFWDRGPGNDAAYKGSKYSSQFKFDEGLDTDSDNGQSSTLQEYQQQEQARQDRENYDTDSSYDTYGESEEENAVGSGYSDNDFFRKFKSLPREKQEEIIKQFGTGKHIEDPRMNRIYKALRQYVKKGTDIGDSAPSNNEIDMLVKALNADGANVTKEQLMKAYASFKKDAQVADSKIVDEDAGPKQGLTPDQWPTEVEDPNTGEMKPVGDIKKADSKKLKKNDLVTIIGAKRVKSKVKDSVDITWSDDSVYVNGMYAGFIDRPVQGTEDWRGGVVCKENDYGYVRFGDGDPEALKQQMEEYINKHEDQVLASCDKSTAIKDSRTTPYNMVIAQLRNIPVGKTGNLNFETGNYDFQFDVTARDGKSYDICMSSPEVGNCQSVAEGNAFQMIKSLADAYIKKNSPASYSDIKDSARQFKVYYLDENRKTRTLFVKAADEDDALEVAAEKIPAGCEVHSAVDTNPLG